MVDKIIKIILNYQTKHREKAEMLFISDNTYYKLLKESKGTNYLDIQAKVIYGVRIVYSPSMKENKYTLVGKYYDLSGDIYGEA